MFTDFDLNRQCVKRPLAVNNQHIMWFNALDTNQNSLDLRWKHIYTTDNQHVIRTTAHAGDTGMSATTDAWFIG